MGQIGVFLRDANAQLMRISLGENTVDDEQLQRRMRDWNEAEIAAKHAERVALRSQGHGFGDAVETPQQRAARLRRAADAILASILEDVRTRRVVESA